MEHGTWRVVLETRGYDFAADKEAQWCTSLGAQGAVEQLESKIRMQHAGSISHGPHEATIFVPSGPGAINLPLGVSLGPRPKGQGRRLCKRRLCAVESGGQCERDVIYGSPSRKDWRQSALKTLEPGETKSLWHKELEAIFAAQAKVPNDGKIHHQAVLLGNLAKLPSALTRRRERNGL